MIPKPTSAGTLDHLELFNVIEVKRGRNQAGSILTLISSNVDITAKTPLLNTAKLHATQLHEYVPSHARTHCDVKTRRNSS
jgi:hypothetical protein